MGGSGESFVAASIFCYTYSCQRKGNRLACRLIHSLQGERLRESFSRKATDGPETLLNNRLPLGPYGDTFGHYLRRSAFPAIHLRVAHARIIAAIPS